MIHALYLIQNLKKQGLDFVFKGGTSLILLLENANRFSVDIDIVLSKKYESASTKAEVAAILDEIVNNSTFTSWALDEKRSYKNGVPKAHYKLSYDSVYDPSGYILLDILFEKNYYPIVVEVPVQTRWIESDETINVLVPDIDSIAGDKLTAFAPNTMGIRYEDEKELEIIKQLYDIGNLFDEINSVETVARSFSAFAQEEIRYRGMDIGSLNVLDDIIETAKIIALREKNTAEPFKSHFAELQRGIRNFAPFLISGYFHLDDAIAASAKAAYLSAKILAENYAPLEKYVGEDVSGTMIENPDWNFLNKLRRLPDKSAFYYWYKAVELLRK
ncbi:nucleotidyl transferase AbiEii/AbiGii toxin family protein [Planktothrix sp. FACHB-1355]|uniref:nucleotidyl transferase AbiEii/AbiGii toxin family protein n=1 Tax=Planktothrix sp. FACHB-1355 TaxID=2692854 RepID=UPI001A7E9967|nr:nucleotidyl transferase AbiEii/AbiGii toxin family protein [Planktothrix sp. FACHB-1355]